MNSRQQRREVRLRGLLGGHRCGWAGIGPGYGCGGRGGVVAAAPGPRCSRS